MKKMLLNKSSIYRQIRLYTVYELLKSYIILNKFIDRKPSEESIYNVVEEDAVCKFYFQLSTICSMKQFLTEIM